jgi:transcriptional regulator with XRE-family HTH domain
MATPRDLGPALLKRRLGEELRKLRQAAEVTVAQAAAELGSGEAKVRHLENGRNVPSKPDLTVLMTLYKAPPNVREDLDELRLAARRRGWWSHYRLPNWLHNYMGLEADATKIRSFELELVPGLLQTEAYARAVHTLGPNLIEPSEVDLMVAARLKRQEMLTREEPVEFHAIMSEAAFHRLRGSKLAVGQYQHLLAMIELPNITIQILPFAKLLHQSMSGGFILLSLPDDTYETVAFVDYALGGQMEHESSVVTRLSQVYEELAKEALSVDASAAFIRELLEKGE